MDGEKTVGRRALLATAAAAIVTAGAATSAQEARPGTPAEVPQRGEKLTPDELFAPPASPAAEEVPWTARPSRV